MRRRQVAEFCREADPLTCTADDVARWMACESWAPATRAANRSALRSFFAWLHATGRRPDDPAFTLPTVRVPPAARLPVSDAALERAREAATDPRDRLMLELAARAGLRRAEIAGLRFADLLDTDDGPVLRVTGKGHRTRVVPVCEDLAAMVRAAAPVYVFPAGADGHLAPGTVGEHLSRMLGPGWSGHALRHRYASKAYAADRDLLAVQRLLGHTSPATTQVYVALPLSQLRRAARAAS
jgi:site-specific recombinase XerC